MQMCWLQFCSMPVVGQVTSAAFAPVVNDGQATRPSARCWPLSGIVVLSCSCILSLQPWLMHLSNAEARQVPLEGSQALGCRPGWGLHGTPPTDYGDAGFWPILQASGAMWISAR